jgi:hypothetical protein
MKTNPVVITNQLNACLKEREQVADLLQNDVNQMLASVLLGVQFTKVETLMAGDKFFMQAESNLETVIEKLNILHYSLSREINHSSLYTS